MSKPRGKTRELEVVRETMRSSGLNVPAELDEASAAHGAQAEGAQAATRAGFDLSHLNIREPARAAPDAVSQSAGPAASSAAAAAVSAAAPSGQEAASEHDEAPRAGQDAKTAASGDAPGADDQAAGAGGGADPSNPAAIKPTSADREAAKSGDAPPVAGAQADPGNPSSPETTQAENNPLGGDPAKPQRPQERALNADIGADIKALNAHAAQHDPSKPAADAEHASEHDQNEQKDDPHALENAKAPAGDSGAQAKTASEDASQTAKVAAGDTHAQEKAPAGGAQVKDTPTGGDHGVAQRQHAPHGGGGGAALGHASGAGGGHSGPARGGSGAHGAGHGARAAHASTGQGHAGAHAASDPAAAATGVNALSTGGAALVNEELAEHERWGAASATVGAAGSVDRAAFIADAAGNGLGSSALEGAAMGLGMGLAVRGLEHVIPIPGLGPAIGGVMAARAMIQRDWGATGRTISQFGQGSDTYEVLANSIASAAEVIDVVTNIMNVVAGVLGIISMAMWIITVLTVGIATPLAATLSAIAAGIGVASMILDAIKSAVLQPAVMMFRALHTFTSDADPRTVAAQGQGITAASNAAAGGIGGLAGGLLSSVGGKGGTTPEEAPPHSQPTNVEAPPRGAPPPEPAVRIEPPSSGGAVDAHGPTAAQPAMVDPFAPTQAHPAMVDPLAPTQAMPAVVDPLAPTQAMPAQPGVSPLANTVEMPVAGRGSSAAAVDPLAPTQAMPAQPAVSPLASTVEVPVAGGPSSPVSPLASTVEVPVAGGGGGSPVSPLASTVEMPAGGRGSSAAVDPHGPTGVQPTAVDPLGPTGAQPAVVDPFAPTGAHPAAVDPHGPTGVQPAVVDPFAPTGAMPAVPEPVTPARNPVQQMTAVDPAQVSPGAPQPAGFQSGPVGSFEPSAPAPRNNNVQIWENTAQPGRGNVEIWQNILEPSSGGGPRPSTPEPAPVAPPSSATVDPHGPTGTMPATVDPYGATGAQPIVVAEGANPNARTVLAPTGEMVVVDSGAAQAPSPNRASSAAGSNAPSSEPITLVDAEPVTLRNGEAVTQPDLPAASRPQEVTRVYTAEEMAALRAQDRQIGIQDAAEALVQRHGDQLENFENLSPEQRHALAEAFGEELHGRFTADHEGGNAPQSPDVTLMQGADPHSLGLNRPDANAIDLNADSPFNARVTGPEDQGLLGTLGHEYGHTNQARQAANPEGFIDPAHGRQMAANEANYIPPEADYPGYRAQPMETDARTWGQESNEALARALEARRDAAVTQEMPAVTREMPAAVTQPMPTVTQPIQAVTQPMEAVTQRMPAVQRPVAPITEPMPVTAPMRAETAALGGQRASSQPAAPQPQSAAPLEAQQPLLLGPGRGQPQPRPPGPTLDPLTGQPVGRFIVDPLGNTLIEPQGGATQGNPQGTFVETQYPNGSPYQQLHGPHRNVPDSHGHGLLPGAGRNQRGPSLDVHGNVVPENSPAAHWPVNQAPRPPGPGRAGPVGQPPTGPAPANPLGGAAAGAAAAGTVDSSGARTVPVNPHYTPPPGTPEQIQVIRNQIENLLASRTQMSRTEAQMATQQQHHEQNRGQLQQARAQLDESSSAAQGHAAATAQRQAANQAQQGRQEEAQGTVSQYAQRAAGLTVLTVPLSGFASFTHIASMLPGDVGAAMLRMNGDANRMLATFARLGATMAGVETQGPARQGALQSDAQQLQATAQQNVGAQDQFQKASADTQTVHAANEERINQATQGRRQAAAHGAQIDSAVQAKQAQADSLAERMQAWAQEHRAERARATQTTADELRAQGHRVTVQGGS
jgi:hypothetical protein